jgi:hypothetical protein
MLRRRGEEEKVPGGGGRRGQGGRGAGWGLKTALTGGLHLSAGERERRRGAGGAACWAGNGELGRSRKKRGGRGKWAVGRRLGFVFFSFFSFLFQIHFKPIFRTIFKSNILHLFKFKFSHKFSQTFSQLFLRLFHNYFKTFKTTPQPKLMHFNMMHKHLIDSNY